jgi:hypothetical protein
MSRVLRNSKYSLLYIVYYTSDEKRESPSQSSESVHFLKGEFRGLVLRERERKKRGEGRGGEGREGKGREENDTLTK